jgi:hypothetical protein
MTPFMRHFKELRLFADTLEQVPAKLPTLHEVAHNGFGALSCAPLA